VIFRARFPRALRRGWKHWCIVDTDGPRCYAVFYVTFTGSKRRKWLST